MPIIVAVRCAAAASSRAVRPDLCRRRFHAGGLRHPSRRLGADHWERPQGQRDERGLGQCPLRRSRRRDVAVVGGIQHWAGVARNSLWSCHSTAARAADAVRGVRVEVNSTTATTTRRPAGRAASWRLRYTGCSRSSRWR